MTRAISIDRWRTALVALFVLTAALVLVATTQPAPAADVVKEDEPLGEEPRPVEDGVRQERIVVTPEPPHWSGWGDWQTSQHASAPRIRLKNGGTVLLGGPPISGGVLVLALTARG
jgi:hypothetical protein